MEYFQRSSLIFDELAKSSRLINEIVKVQQVIINALEAKNNIFWCGNGGSASDAEHLAAELVGRFERNRRPLNSIALTTNSSAITAISNDFGFQHIFERQIEALGRKGDVLISISTSGESLNVIKGIEKAKSLEMKTISLLGKEGGAALKLSDYSVVVNSNVTAHIQEAHIAIGQALCGQIEKHFLSNHDN
jgi:D-sedoheptulose 7-phosphate isomerase